jgi:hypothetical protein
MPLIMKGRELVLPLALNGREAVYLPRIETGGTRLASSPFKGEVRRGMGLSMMDSSVLIDLANC